MGWLDKPCVVFPVASLKSMKSVVVIIDYPTSVVLACSVCDEDDDDDEAWAADDGRWGMGWGERIT